MNIPPIVGLVISLSLGMIIGGITCYQYLDKEQIEADVKQVKDDNKLAVDIDNETNEAKETNTVTNTIIKWRIRPPVKIPRGLTDDEIDIICTAHFVPTDIMLAIRSEAAKARRRFNNVQNDNATGR